MFLVWIWGTCWRDRVHAGAGVAWRVAHFVFAGKRAALSKLYLCNLLYGLKDRRSFLFTFSCSKVSKFLWQIEIIVTRIYGYTVCTKNQNSWIANL